MTSLAQIAVVFRKEVKDAFRDRRSLYSILAGAIFGPLITGFMLNSIADRQRKVEEVRVPVVGMEHAPALMDWLRQQAGVEIVAGPADPEAAVRERDEDVVVVVTEEFGEEVPVVVAGAGQARRRRLAQRGAPEGAAGSLVVAALQHRNRDDAARRPRGQSGDRVGDPARRRRGLELAAARRHDPLVHPALHRHRRLHRRDADRDRFDGGRTRARIARTAAREPGAAPDVCGGEVAGRELCCRAQRSHHDRPRPADAAVDPAAGAGHPVSNRAAPDRRPARGASADVPDGDRAADLPRDLRAVLQGSPELHGHPDHAADDPRHADDRVSDHQPGVDVSDPAARSTRAGHRRVGWQADAVLGVSRRRRRRLHRRRSPWCT